MNAVRNDVEKLVEKELAAANEKFPQFHSTHEGYAVILEEIQETEAELTRVKIIADKLWHDIKHNCPVADINNSIVSMRESAINTACEAIQVAAMCNKFLGFDNRKEGLKVKTEKGTSAQDILLSLEHRYLSVGRAINGKIMVSYGRSDVKDGVFLVGIVGRGDTFAEACEDYLKQIRGKTLVFDSGTDHREEIKFLG